MLSAIRNMGWIYIQKGQQAEGLALLGLVLYHPSTLSAEVESLQELLTELEFDIENTAVTTNLYQGKSMDLEATAASILSTLMNQKFS